MNIEMKPHNPRIPFRSGFLSVQASEYNYCSPKHNQGPYFSYELAFFNERDDFAKIPELEPNGDQVYGYVDKVIVIELLEQEGYTPHQIKEMLPDE
tara:strand:+ start:2048 stop:2335 length:288 start_codon:yes stop_codon:yes gene_type:complete